MKPLIVTDRLILRAITLDDIDDLFGLHSDPEVQKFTGEPVVKSPDQIRRAILRRITDYKMYGFGRLAVINKETNQFIGWAGLTYLPEFQKVDLGYRFHVKFWGKGYATEASKAILENGFKKHNLDVIIAIAYPENKASIRVMEKVGMKYDKHAPYEKGERDLIWYHLSKNEYLNEAVK